MARIQQQLKLANHASRLVVGISGASCSGKTTLTKLLKATFPWASVVHQDAYYHPNEPKFHVYLPDVNHFNWDVKTAVDFTWMEKDLQQVLLKSEQRSKEQCHLSDSLKLNSKEEQLLCFPNDDFVQRHRPQENEVKYLISRFSKIPLTILEGHIIFNHPQFYQLCNLRYFLTLDQDELFTRRRQRVYDPPNPPGYLEKYVWPAYASRLEEARKLPSIKYYNAKTVPLFSMYQQIRQDVALEMACMLGPRPSITPDQGRNATMHEDQNLKRMSG